MGRRSKTQFRVVEESWNCTHRFSPIKNLGTKIVNNGYTGTRLVKGEGDTKTEIDILSFTAES